MIVWYCILLAIFYLSLVMELSCWHVPSVASSLNIFRQDPEHVAQFSPRFQRWFAFPRWLKVLLFLLPLVAIALVHVFPFLPLFSGWIPVKFAVDPGSWAIGSILVISGRTMSLMYLKQMRDGGGKRGESEFVTDGMFRISRNPGLIGLYLSFFGFLVIVPHIAFAVFFIIYILYMHSKVLMEEDYLTLSVGRAYEQYLSETRRYL